MTIRQMEDALRPQFQELCSLIITLRGLLDGGLLTAVSASLTQLKALLDAGLIEKIDELAFEAAKQRKIEA